MRSEPSLVAANSVFGIPEVRIVVAVASVLALVAVLVYAVAWLRDRLLGAPDRSEVEHLEQFRDLAREGTIGQDEFLKVRSAIATLVKERHAPSVDRTRSLGQLPSVPRTDSNESADRVDPVGETDSARDADGRSWTGPAN